MPSKQRVTGVCFTHNNYEDGDIEKIKAWDGIAYGVIGKEVGESGTPHLQGYIKLAKRSALKTVTDKLQELLGRRPHCEKTRGSPKQASDYCKKDGDFVEWGDMPKQGKRMDLEAAFAAADSDMKMIDLAREHQSTFIRYHKGIGKVRELHNAEKAEDWRDVLVKVYTGPTGCGKTRMAMAKKCDDGRPPYKIQASQLQWWDGYEGESHIVIDEYANDVKCTQMLALLDGYKLRLPIKGGFTYARWKHVVITTNLKKEQIHAQAEEEHRNAFMRRVASWQSWWAAAAWDRQVESCSSRKRGRSAMEDTDSAMTMEDGQDDPIVEWTEDLYNDIFGAAQDPDGWVRGLPPSPKRSKINDDFVFE